MFPMNKTHQVLAASNTEFGSQLGNLTDNLPGSLCPLGHDWLAAVVSGSRLQIITRAQACGGTLR